MRYTALAFLFVFLFASCGGSDPSGSSTLNGFDDGPGEGMDDPIWGPNYERAKALCRPFHEEYLARSGHLEQCAKMNLGTCGQLLVLTSEQGRQLDPRDTYENLVRSCAIEFYWASTHGVLFEDGDLNRASLFMSMRLDGMGLLNSEDYHNAFTLGILDRLPTPAPCEDGKTTCGVSVRGAGQGILVDVPATVWLPCVSDERFETLTCGGWVLTAEDSKSEQNSAMGNGRIEYIYRHPTDGTLTAVGPGYSSHVVVRAQAPDGSVKRFVHFPNLGTNELPRTKGKLYTLSFEATPGYIPPPDLPLLPTYFDPRTWTEMDPSKMHMYDGRVYQSFPAVPYFGAVGIGTGYIGAWRGDKILSLDGEEVGCTYSDGILVAPDAPAITDLCWQCRGKWVYIALPPAAP
ncbi:MAG: hypothetical protein Q7S89_03600 [bacterium]|nr:hypothetical protein [bacterium]